MSRLCGKGLRKLHYVFRHRNQDNGRYAQLTCNIVAKEHKVFVWVFNASFGNEARARGPSIRVYVSNGVHKVLYLLYPLNLLLVPAAYTHKHRIYIFVCTSSMLERLKICVHSTRHGTVDYCTFCAPEYARTFNIMNNTAQHREA